MNVSKLVAWVAAGSLVATAAACRRAPKEGPPQRVKLLSRIVMAESSQGLVDSLNGAIPGIHSLFEAVPGSEYVVDEVENGEAELGFAQADVVYTAYRSGTSARQAPHEHLKAIAVGRRATVFPVIRAGSTIRTIADLEGKRIGLDPVGSYGEVYARMVLKVYGLEDTSVTITHLLPDDMAAALHKGMLDAAIFVGPSPTAIARINAGTPLRFLEVDRTRINTLRGRYPFLMPTAFPTADETDGPTLAYTVGVDNVLVCRGDLTEDLVYRITTQLFAESDRVQKHDPSSAPWIDIERAPATPIPLHAGAARYYRERQIVQ